MLLDIGEWNYAGSIEIQKDLLAFWGLTFIARKTRNKLPK